MAWSSPVPKGSRIGSNFGPRNGILHAGDDYPPPRTGQQGVGVYSVGDGIVVGDGANLLSGHSGDRNVLIQHPGNIFSYYGHLNSNVVSKGDRVKGGQKIGVMGYRGNTVPRGVNGTHLHLGIIVNGRFVDPSVWLNSRGISVGQTPPVKGSSRKPYPDQQLSANPTWNQLFSALDLVVRGAHNPRVKRKTRAGRIQQWLLDGGYLKQANGKPGIVDGKWGPESWKALQRRLADKKWDARKPYTGPFDGLAPRSSKVGTTWHSAAAFANDRRAYAKKV